MVLATGAGAAEDLVVWPRVDGEPASVLAREAKQGARLIVVGSRGFWAHPGVLGSTSLRLAERIPVPVAIVPRGDQP